MEKIDLTKKEADENVINVSKSLEIKERKFGKNKTKA
jgi:hypothetical protein